MLNFIYEYFISNNIANPEAAMFFARTTYLCVIFILAVISDVIAKKIILRFISYLIKRTDTEWDDKLHEKKVFANLSHLAPAVVIYLLAPGALIGFTSVVTILKNMVVVYVIVITVMTFFAFLNAVQDIYDSFEASKEVPIKSFVQITKLGIFMVAFIIAFAVLLNKSPFYLISGLGALTAILLLIFRDVIMGFVAGVQLIANKMVTRGDWITMDKYEADGNVIDIALTTVKVRNFDNTITTIPTYALISESFKNWRGMEDSKGRRIKRSIYINVNSIKLCSEDMLKRFAKIKYISDYIEKKKEEISKANKEAEIDESVLANGRKMTNLGTFREYIVKYLENNPKINKDLTLIVRQLSPTEHGIPLEVYCFSSDKNWVAYEKIQSDIFDHLYAVIKEFELEPYQSPSGSDFKSVLVK